MLPAAASQPLHAAREAEKDKNEKYQRQAGALGYNFFPLAMEHGAAMGPSLPTCSR